MKEQLISFKTATLAKERGFDIRVHSSYYTPDDGKTNCVHNWSCDVSNSDYISDNRYSAPTQSLLQKWLREKHNVLIELVYNPAKNGFWMCRYGLIHVEGKTYEEALETGLQEALKLI